MTTTWRIAAGLAVGAAVGAAIGYFGQCSTGACPLTSTWWRGAIWGAALGLVATARTGAG